MVKGKHFLKISALQFFRFGIDSVLKILNKRITESMHELINDGGDCITASATLGLLSTRVVAYFLAFLSNRDANNLVFHS